MAFAPLGLSCGSLALHPWVDLSLVETAPASKVGGRYLALLGKEEAQVTTQLQAFRNVLKGRALFMHGCGSYESISINYTSRHSIGVPGRRVKMLRNGLPA